MSDSTYRHVHTELRHKAVGKTDVGRKRKSNEDALLINDEIGLFIVCDGMGGHAAGEVASAEAVEAAYGMVRRGLTHLKKLSDPIVEEDAHAACRLMESAGQAATYFVYSMGQLEADKTGMGTTLSALLVLGEYVVTAQVGDSRIYRVRKEEVEQLTEDHTLIDWQLKQGLITAEEAQRSPHKNVITRAVGNRDYVQVDTRIMRVESGDRFLLCSDGLHGYLKDPDIAPIVGLGGEKAVDAFIALANDRGGKDNITVIQVEIN